MPSPPPLPPRRHPPSPVTASDITSSISSAVATEQIPPPLPPRTGLQRDHAPPPILVSQARTDTTSQPRQRNAEESHVNVAVAFAAPQHEREQSLNESHDDNEALERQRSATVGSTVVEPNSCMENILINDEHVSAAEATWESGENNEEAATAPPRKCSSLQYLEAAPLTNTQWIFYTTGLVLLAYCGVPLICLILIALGGYYLFVRAEQKNHSVPYNEGLKEQQERTQDTVDGLEAVGWVNHALYALFPLISTDVLTPFLDLLEDALAEEVPSIITSVRLTSPSLGAQPLVLTSLKPMSDEQWFDSLSTQNEKPNGHRKRGSSPEPPISCTFPLTPKTEDSSQSSLYGRKSHRNQSSSSLPLPNDTDDLKQPKSTFRSVNNGDDIAADASSRRKRDRILHSITHRVPQHTNSEYLSTPAEVGVNASKLPTSSMEGSGADNNANEDEEEDEGRYVNYQVGFEYKRGKDAMRKGKGLHCLAYFGIGLKGLGRVEVPVYIDILYIKGTINLRLLLSPTTPFIKTGTFSLPSIPAYDISANPLARGSFNAMNIPLMKPYVNTSIRSVLSAFLCPRSYTLEIDRLLLGSPSSIRTETIGVLHIILHSANDLPKADAMGSCDPYLELGYKKMPKPVFSTRTIGRTRNPVWEEECFVMVRADTVELGDFFRIRANDADRFSADDTLGAVFVDLASLISSSSNELQHRSDPFVADQPGMKASGILNWSVRFCPLWQMSREESDAKLGDSKKLRLKAEPPGAPDPYWLTLMKSFLPKEEDWHKERTKRREEAKAWLEGKKDRELLEAQEPANNDRPSGVLHFHIHQCLDLESESTSGTYSSRPHQDSGGPPALAHLTDRTAMENPDPPSAYCEVHLNDKMVYKTRTKEVTPSPYFNAVSERFVRDWRKGKMIFVIRDDRDREHDPILGLVKLQLSSLFSSTSHVTRWFPLTGGLGWGRLRVSLLWKSLDMSLPPNISGFEIGTIQVRNLVFTPLYNETEKDRLQVAVMRTDYDKLQVHLIKHDESNLDEIQEFDSPIGSQHSVPFSPFPLQSLPTSPPYAIPYNHHPTLVIMYRHSASLHISLFSRRSFGKKKLVGVGTIRLGDIPDGEAQRRIGVWEGARGEDGNWELDFEGEADNTLDTQTANSPALIQSFNLARVQSNVSKRSSRSLTSPNKRLVGYLNISWIIVPGISKVHQKIAKRDLRFARDYEAWETARDVDQEYLSLSNEMELGEEGDNSKSDGEEENDEEEEKREEKAETNSLDIGNETGSAKDRERSENRAHSHALHKKHKGVSQLALARTGRFVKDKLTAQVYKVTNGAEQALREGYGRRRGTDAEVEKEGLSKL
ncbi:uncharacterized protein L203_100110 [Cryptococcus depauperatus CBS 7841]|uniref:C2 domain-containing protein n=1 Tax=Cryptococcus depauperatus CBS 7841 TaxID=1295531 RepID=A0AAJ8LX55_9TREE